MGCWHLSFLHHDFTVFLQDRHTHHTLSCFIFPTTISALSNPHRFYSLHSARKYVDKSCLYNPLHKDQETHFDSDLSSSSPTESPSFFFTSGFVQIAMRLQFSSSRSHVSLQGYYLHWPLTQPDKCRPLSLLQSPCSAYLPDKKFLNENNPILLMRRRSSVWLSMCNHVC